MDDRNGVGDVGERETERGDKGWIGARDGGRTPVRGDSCVHFQPSRRQNRSVAPDIPAARLSPVPACVA